MARAFLCLLCFLPLVLWGQVTYEQALADGISRYEALDYEDAIKKFEAAHILAEAKGPIAIQEVDEWIIKAQEARFNALTRQLAISDSLRQAAISEKAKAEAARNRADIALKVSNQLLDQFYYHKGRYGFTVKQVLWQGKPRLFNVFITRNQGELDALFDEVIPFSLRDGFARVKYVKGVDPAGVDITERALLDTLGNLYDVATFPKYLGSRSQALVIDGTKSKQYAKLKKISHFLDVAPRVKIIIIHDTKLKQLTPTISSLDSLFYIDLHNNRLPEVPNTLTQISQLTHLNLAHNELTAMPTRMDLLSHLTYLNLTGNPIPQAEVERIRKLLPDCRVEF